MLVARLGEAGPPLEEEIEAALSEERTEPIHVIGAKLVHGDRYHEARPHRGHLRRSRPHHPQAGPDQGSRESHEAGSATAPGSAQSFRSFRASAMTAQEKAATLPSLWIA